MTQDRWRWRQAIPRLLPKAVAGRVRAGAGGPGDPDPAPAPSRRPRPAGEAREGKSACPAAGAGEGTGACAATEIVRLDAAKTEQGIGGHRAYVSSVNHHCTLASMPERVGAFVRANVPVDQVRKDLLAARAAEPVVMPHHPLLPPQQSTPGLVRQDHLAKISARLKK